MVLWVTAPRARGSAVTEQRVDAAARAHRWPAGFVDFYHEHYQAMVRLATLITMRRDLGEEVVQETFLAARDRWPDVRQPVAYLRRAVINNSRTAVRRSLREVVVATIPETSDVGHVDLPEDMTEVWEALGHLPPRRRIAIVLRFYEGLDDRVIADLMGCRPATVRSLVHRATRQLRRILS